MRTALNSRKHKARQLGLPFTITEDDLDIPVYCPVLGIRLEYSVHDAGKRPDNKATIDRLDPKKGYVPGNVFIISFRANRLKSDASVEELTKIANWITQHGDT